MNKIIKLLSVIFIYYFSIVNLYWYTAVDCSDFWERICPSYIIWKVIDNPKKTIIKEIWDNKEPTVNETDQITFPMERNRFFMFDNKIKEYPLNDIILNRIQLHSNSRTYIPKKWDILLYDRHWSLDISSNNLEKFFFNKLDREDSYVENGQNIMWKNEYDSIMNWYSGSFLLNDHLQNYNIIYCENDTIKIKPHNNTSFNTYLPFKKWQLPTKGTWDYSKWEIFLRDMFTNPKVSIDKYNQNNLENDLQYLSPCSNFNEIFWIEDIKILKTEDNEKKSKIPNVIEDTQRIDDWNILRKTIIIIVLLWILLIFILYFGLRWKIKKRWKF